MRCLCYPYFALASALFVLASVSRADFRVVGSDLLGLEFTRAFYSYAGGKGIKLALAFDGSRPGLTELSAGRADLALLVLPPDEMAALAGFETRILGYHRVVVMVPATLPVTTVDFAQLARVFGTSRPEVTPLRWGELGITGDWSGSVVTGHAPEVGTGIALELFRRMVLAGGKIGPGVQRFSAPRELAATIARGERGLAIAAAPPVEATGGKLLAVARNEKGDAYLPTWDNLRKGRYPLGLALQMVFRPERKEALRDLMTFLLADEATRWLEAAEVLPLPSEERAELLRTGR